jgi:hypothetical protein
MVKSKSLRMTSDFIENTHSTISIFLVVEKIDCVFFENSVPKNLMVIIMSPFQNHLEVPFSDASNCQIVGQMSHSIP